MSYGSSPTLDEDNDFVVDSTGDIKSTLQEPSTTAEVEKDLAFFSQIQLQSQIGSAITPSTTAVIRNRVREIANDDSRVDNVLSVEVRQVKDGYEISMSIQLVDDDTNFELVFEVNK